MNETPLDPLFVIFEEHLCNFHDSEVDRKTFIGKVITDYLAFLRKRNIVVPKSLESAIVEELGHQVHSMLAKKIYGSLNIQDYQKNLPVPVKKRARSRYSRLKRG